MSLYIHESRNRMVLKVYSIIMTSDYDKYRKLKPGKFLILYIIFKYLWFIYKYIMKWDKVLKPNNNNLKYNSFT
jgi:hypothetical protein